MCLQHHGIQGQKWGVRNGPPYPLNNKAKKLYREAENNEKGITSDIQKIVKKYNCKMYGLENRLKTQNSIDRKIRKGKSIKDAVRYTILSNDNDYVKNYFNIKNDLESLNYIETRCKNYFEEYRQGKVKHKSVQCNFKAKNGYEFEIQFHTPSSQRVKDKKVPLYEEVRSELTPISRKTEILIEMAKMADTIPDPKGIKRIKSH